MPKIFSDKYFKTCMHACMHVHPCTLNQNNPVVLKSLTITEEQCCKLTLKTLPIKSVFKREFQKWYTDGFANPRLHVINLPDVRCVSRAVGCQPTHHPASLLFYLNNNGQSDTESRSPEFNIKEAAIATGRHNTVLDLSKTAQICHLIARFCDVHIVTSTSMQTLR